MISIPVSGLFPLTFLGQISDSVVAGSERMSPSIFWSIAKLLTRQAAQTRMSTKRVRKCTFPQVFTVVSTFHFHNLCQHEIQYPFTVLTWISLVNNEVYFYVFIHFLHFCVNCPLQEVWTIYWKYIALQICTLGLLFVSQSCVWLFFFSPSHSKA